MGQMENEPTAIIICKINVVKRSLKIASKALIYNWSFNKHFEISFYKAQQPIGCPRHSVS